MRLDDPIRRALRRNEARSAGAVRRIFGQPDPRDEDKVDDLTLEQQIEHHDRRRVEAEQRVAAYEHGLPVEHAHLIAGDTAEEMAADAEKMAAQRRTTSHDSGVRQLEPKGPSVDDRLRAWRDQLLNTRGDAA